MQKAAIQKIIALSAVMIMNLELLHKSAGFFIDEHE
jgi:hypothetical protein